MDTTGKTIAAHTPGPWRNVQDGSGDPQAVYGGDDIVAEYVANSANARLIAAAPDLLAALQRAHWALDMLTGCTLLHGESDGQRLHFKMVCDEADKARDAIAKAGAIVSRLYVADPTGNFIPATDGIVIDAARDAVGRVLRRGVTFDSPAAARKYLPAMLGAREHEVFCLAHLDNRHRLIAFEELFRGTIDGASVHPREVVKSVLAHNSAAIILVHNHPSGVSEPSQADELITRRLREALALIDIRIIDHFIVAGTDVLSFAERGLL